MSEVNAVILPEDSIVPCDISFDELPATINWGLLLAPKTAR